MRRKKVDPLMASIEREVKAMLGRNDLSATERLKAIEIGAKVLSIRHKIQDGDAKDGSFFADK